MQQQSIKILGAALIMATAVTSCKKDSKLDTTVYLPSGNKTTYINFDKTDTIPLIASLVGTDYATVALSAPNDINVQFNVNTALVENFNRENGTAYAPLPADNFTLPASGIIEKGKNSTTPLDLIIRNGDQLDAFSSYLLPVSIQQVSGGHANKWQTTAWYVVTRSPALEDLPVYDRSAWSIAGFSTQEPAEGGGNGLAQAAIDNKYNTYWQSQWAGGEPGPPHFITIDMGEAKVVHGVAIVDRAFSGDWAINGHGQPKAMTVALSKDGTNFTDNGNFQVRIESDPQKEIRFFLPVFTEARYIRFTVTSVWASNSTNIAEIYAL